MISKFKSKLDKNKEGFKMVAISNQTAANSISTPPVLLVFTGLLGFLAFPEALSSSRRMLKNCYSKKRRRHKADDRDSR